MLRLFNIAKSFLNASKITAGIEHVSAVFAIGEFVLVTGESGSGKSTLLNILAGTENYSSGEMYIGGEDAEYFGDDDWQKYRKEKVAVVNQDFQLIENISVYKNVEVAYALNHDTDKRSRRNAINEILRRTGLSKYAKQSVATLSGGQKQRVAIARALAKDTPIILADEPTGNLDKAASAEIAALLGEISRDKLLIVVTHNDEQFDGIATRQLVMSNGTIVSDVTKTNKQALADELSVSAKTDNKEKRKGNPTKALLAIPIAVTVIPLLKYLYEKPIKLLRE